MKLRRPSKNRVIQSVKSDSLVPTVVTKVSRFGIQDNDHYVSPCERECGVDVRPLRTDRLLVGDFYEASPAQTSLTADRTRLTRLTSEHGI